MNEHILSLINALADSHSLSLEQYAELIESRAPETAALLAQKAVAARKAIYGNDVYVRGLIEISNICKNDCLYCGIRRSNKNCDRYRLTKEQITDCAAEGYRLGFRTFVLQGGEDPYYTDNVLCDIVSELKSIYPDCAVTLSMGERSRESYELLRRSGADRYLLRHETADKAHYESLHPNDMSFENRMHCLRDLRDLGYQVGCGFMVGSPNQTSNTLAKDLKFIEEFKPDMCGIGPFVPHKDTPFRDCPAGTVELTCYLLSIIRLIHPPVLLPATTALGTIHPEGREMGIKAGANVVMPNLSPVSVRKKYELYDNKICTGEESAQCKDCLSARMESVGYHIVTSRGGCEASKMTVNMKLIVNPDIRLESITKETTEALYPLFMEDIRELNRWFGFDADYSIQNDYHYLDNRKPPYDDAIVVFYRGVPCGRFGLYDYSPGENSIYMYYWISSRFRRKGIALAAMEIGRANV